jgi:hypothetical protein
MAEPLKPHTHVGKSSVRGAHSGDYDAMQVMGSALIPKSGIRGNAQAFVVELDNAFLCAIFAGKFDRKLA